MPRNRLVQVPAAQVDVLDEHRVASSGNHDRRVRGADVHEHSPLLDVFIAAELPDIAPQHRYRFGVDGHRSQTGRFGNAQQSLGATADGRPSGSLPGEPCRPWRISSAST